MLRGRVQMPLGIILPVMYDDGSTCRLGVPPSFTAYFVSVVRPVRAAETGFDGPMT